MLRRRNSNRLVLMSTTTILMVAALALALPTATECVLRLFGIDPYGAALRFVRRLPTSLILGLNAVAITYLLMVVGIDPSGRFNSWVSMSPPWLIRILVALSVPALVGFVLFGYSNWQWRKLGNRAVNILESAGEGLENIDNGLDAALEPTKPAEDTRHTGRLASQRAKYAKLERLEWLHQTHPRHRYAQPGSLEYEEFNQRIHELINLGVLKPSDQRSSKSEAFRGRLARLIAEERIRLNLPPRPSQPT